MNDALIDQIVHQLAGTVRRAKTYAAQGAIADARRCTQRAQCLLTVLAHARLVRAATQFTALNSNPS